MHTATNGKHDNQTVPLLCLQLLLTRGFQTSPAGPVSLMRFLDVVFVFLWQAIFLHVRQQGCTHNTCAHAHTCAHTTHDTRHTHLSTHAHMHTHTLTHAYAHTNTCTHTHKALGTHKPQCAWARDTQESSNAYSVVGAVLVCACTIATGLSRSCGDDNNNLNNRRGSGGGEGTEANQYSMARLHDELEVGLASLADVRVRSWLMTQRTQT